jgi:hypothetical protein
VQTREAIARYDETSVWLTREILQRRVNLGHRSNWRGNRLQVERRRSSLDRRRPEFGLNEYILGRLMVAKELLLR